MGALSDYHSNSCIERTREIFLCTNEDGITNDTFNKFAINFRFLAAKNDHRITIHQSTIGGDWDSGMAIYDLIATSSVPVIFICHGVCASMGSLIPQSCKYKSQSKIITMPNTSWLIHEGECNTSGTYKQCQSSSKVSEIQRQTMIDIYASSSYNSCAFARKKGDEKVSLSYIRSYINDKLREREDWWLTAKEAVMYGFADYVMTPELMKLLEQKCT